MDRYIVTLRSSNGSTRDVIVAAEGLIDARIRADQKRQRGEQIVGAWPYKPTITVG